MYTEQGTVKFDFVGNDSKQRDTLSVATGFLHSIFENQANAHLLEEAAFTAAVGNSTSADEVGNAVRKLLAVGCTTFVCAGTTTGALVANKLELEDDLKMTLAAKERFARHPKRAFPQFPALNSFIERMFEFITVVSPLPDVPKELWSISYAEFFEGIALCLKERDIVSLPWGTLFDRYSSQLNADRDQIIAGYEQKWESRLLRAS